ncbi:MAG: riboflavin biosynthesis protein RibF [Acidobacteria bacterium RIFCSPLOWO2_02_FULL_68_18]|nr:MAG: riboflavin biosynthesis protein RibF [Acidobacteria bacterium RIFCSPLOWO2_02_FULL_68_18]OFW50022.1 MAG: riboflavin biosynthesis protein RibF [Acidobacteria bacterium RIFCSPLOWO2_12_FULL_68_19]
MEVLRFPDDPRPPWIVHPVLALGNFDGLHRGHLKIIERVKRGAAEHGGVAMAMTFDPHPPRVVRPEKAPPLLMTIGQRLEALDRAGIHTAAVIRFSPEISQWEPEAFVRAALVEWLHVSEVWVGANFLFGHGRSGTFTLLRTLGQRYGFRAEKIDPVRYKEFVVSSTRIRRLVGEGRVDEAGALLGHPYVLVGTIVEGRRRGRELGFPTANLHADNELIPPGGVYATTLDVDGVVHAAITNIGVNPTFGDTTAASIETHVLRYAGVELYGRRVQLGFVLRLRDERRFGDVDGLRAQIEADCRRAERLFSRLSV